MKNHELYDGVGAAPQETIGVHMKLLKCKICLGEVDLVGDPHTMERKVKCRKCGFSNDKEKTPIVEVITINRRPPFNGSI
jgi:hypothetical protein